eukprot:gene1572-954_t
MVLCQEELPSSIDLHCSHNDKDLRDPHAPRSQECHKLVVWEPFNASHSMHTHSRVEGIIKTADKYHEQQWQREKQMSDMNSVGREATTREPDPRAAQEVESQPPRQRFYAAMRHLLLRNIPEAIQGGNSEGSLEKKQEYELFGGDDTLDRVLAGARQHESSVSRSGLGAFLVAAAMLAVIRGRLVAFNVNAIRTRAGRSGIHPGELIPMRTALEAFGLSVTPYVPECTFSAPTTPYLVVERRSEGPDLPRSEGMYDFVLGALPQPDIVSDNGGIPHTTLAVEPLNTTFGLYALRQAVATVDDSARGLPRPPTRRRRVTNAPPPSDPDEEMIYGGSEAGVPPQNVYNLRFYYVNPTFICSPLLLLPYS